MLTAGLAVVVGGEAATTSGAVATGVKEGFATSAGASGSKVCLQFIFKLIIDLLLVLRSTEIW